MAEGMGGLGGEGLYLPVMLKIKPAEPPPRVHWSRHSSRAQLHMRRAAVCAHARAQIWQLLNARRRDRTRTRTRAHPHTHWGNIRSLWINLTHALMYIHCVKYILFRRCGVENAGSTLLQGAFIKCVCSSFVCVCALQGPDTSVKAT